MTERREIIATIASFAGTLLTGCLSWSEALTDGNSKTTTETEQSPTTTETERPTTSTETRHSPTSTGTKQPTTSTAADQSTTKRYANEDLIIYNESGEKRDGQVTVTPSTTDTEPFTDEFSLLPREGNPEEFKSVYENIEQMSVDGTVIVDVNGFDEATYEWSKDHPSDYRGLRVYIEDDGIDFMENVR